MQVPLQISFHGLSHSDALESAIRSKVDQLETFCSNIISTRITVGFSEHRQIKGSLFRVRIDMTLPGHEIIVDREPAENQAHQDAYVAIRDAFRAARRQLEDYVRINYRGKKRQHARPPQGKVVRFVLENDGGFLRTPEGREIYFHKNSVLNRSFDKLKIGDEVRFFEEDGDLGPQASTVEKIGKWGRHEALDRNA